MHLVNILDTNTRERVCKGCGNKLDRSVIDKYIYNIGLLTVNIEFI
jgi:hypothetical protein